MNTPLNIAKTFVSAGISVIPVRYQDKRPEIGAWQPYQNRLPTIKELLTWFGGKLHNTGIITGWRGLAVIDFDNIDTYGKWLRWARLNTELSQSVANSAFRVRTARGVHVYVRLQTPERNRKMPNIDVKGVGGYVLGPWSVHPTGAIYTPDGDYKFPMIKTLSDVLPVGMLQHTELPKEVIIPTNIFDPTRQLDPWEIASREPVQEKSAVVKIRRQVRIQDFFPQAKRSSISGRWMMAVCPFHDDHKPSLWIDTERQICGCFACGGRPYDVINLYARLHGLSNQEAIRVLARLL